MTDRLWLAAAAQVALGRPRAMLSALRAGGPPELRSRLPTLDDATRIRIEQDVEELAAAGVGVVFAGEDRYPASLEALPSPPPLLYYRGNVGLLRAPSVGMCGSRDATAQGLEAARVAGRRVAAAGLTIISGYARGVDTETHLAALTGGGSTIIVLAEGILHFRVKRACKPEPIDWSRVLVVSQFAPRQTWNAGSAMMRNAIIAGLGVALVVIEAGDAGGTLDAGLKGIELKRPVLAIDFESGGRPGNMILFQRGAHRVATPRQLAEAIAAVGHSVDRTQLALFS